MRILLWISRVLFGLVFIFSGFVKAIDPLGSAYKFQDYFLSFGLEWMFSLALPLAVVLSTLEFLIGVNILLGIKMRISAWGGLLFMLFFTPLTLYVAIYDPVPDCGCFGDALIISNWQTFYKNIVFLAAAIFIFIKRKEVKPLWSERNDCYLAGVFALTGVLLSVFCLLNLPLIDFRPWKVGNNVLELMTPEPEVADLFLVFENQQTGELTEYPATDYPWDDEEWNELWKFKDQRREIIKPYVPAPIDDFSIYDEYGDDYTDSYIANPDYQFLLVAYDLGATNTRAFSKRINSLAAAADEHGYSFIALTGSSFENIDVFRHEHQTPYYFYQADGVKLKTIIRSNPGLVLMKDGVVLGKWAHRNIPDFETIQKKYMQE
jgi:uncharacterized membrane protein YphA (DoxX/SURF4 family)